MEGTETLRRGELAFSAVTRGQGPVVLCLHGFPDTKDSFRHQMPFLAENGFKVVSVSLRGYEAGSLPKDRDYSLETLAEDVLAFISALGGERVHLIGHDWGAAIAYTVGAMAPEKFSSITTMAIPHSGRFVNQAFFIPKQALLSWYMLFFQLRGVSEYCVRRNDFAFLRWLWRKWSPNWEPEPQALSQVINTFSEPGVLQGALSYYREALSPGRLPVTSARRVDNAYQVSVPTMAMTGKNDGCIDYEVFQQLTKTSDFPKGIEVHVIENAGHFLHQEQPDEVNALLLNWIKRHQT